MKRLTAVLLFVAFLLTACIVPPSQLTPGAVQNAPGPTSGSPAPTDLGPAPQAAVQALSTELGVPVAQIKVMSSEAVEWPNGCLGVAKPGVMCTQNIVPGFRILLEAEGKQYEYHTDQAGGLVQAANAPTGTTNTAQVAASKHLANALGVAATALQLVSSKAVEWPDACLGVAQPDLVCAQVITPGYLFVFATQGRQYEYHTNQDGSLVVPGTIALTWHRAGGIAGFCDDLQIYQAGEIHASRCKPEPLAADGVLTAEERTQFDRWLTQFGSVDLTQTDPAVADAMTTTLTLHGSGTAQPAEADQQALFTFAQNVLQRVLP